MPTRFMCFFALCAPANKIIVSSDAFTFCCWASNLSSTGTKCRCHTDDNLHWSNVEHFETVRREVSWKVGNPSQCERTRSMPWCAHSSTQWIYVTIYLNKWSHFTQLIQESMRVRRVFIVAKWQNVSNFFSLFSFFNLNNLWLKGERDMLENKFTCQLIIQSMWQQKKNTERTVITDKGHKIGWNEANLSIIDRSRIDSAAKCNEMLN